MEQATSESEAEAEAAKRVAFLGPEGSYCHAAALQLYANASANANASTPASADKSYTLHPERTIAAVFAAVQDRTAIFGVVPVENSTNGSVMNTLDLFATTLAETEAETGTDEGDNEQRQSQSQAQSQAPTQTTTLPSTTFPNVQVDRETFVPVHHALLAHPSYQQTPTTNNISTSTATTATPITTQPDTSAIRTIYTHPQAWTQCSRALAADPNLAAADKVDVSSTSRAAALVAADPSCASAAIASELAATRYGCRVLQAGIQDRADNVTRFFALKRDGALARGRSGVVDHHGGDGTTEGDGNDDYTKVKGEAKSLVALTVPHEEPGALADCIGVFKAFGLNLTSINARPSGRAAWQYIFLVEILWSTRGDSDHGDMSRNRTLGEALDQLDKVARRWKWLGSWKSAALPGVVGGVGDR